MYDVVLNKREKYFESKTFSAGKKTKSFKLPWGKFGLTICYDLRFPNLYRKLSKAGCLFISAPSAFTETTGNRHWHSLLKAFNKECQCLFPVVSVNAEGADINKHPALDNLRYKFGNLKS